MSGAQKEEEKEKVPPRDLNNMFTNYGKNAAIKAWEKLMYRGGYDC